MVIACVLFTRAMVDGGRPPSSGESFQEVYHVQGTRIGARGSMEQELWDRDDDASDLSSSDGDVVRQGCRFALLSLESAPPADSTNCPCSFEASSFLVPLSRNLQWFPNLP